MRLLGLELGEHEIRVARGERAFGTVSLIGVERIPYDGAAELAERLAALAAPSTTVLTALPATAVTHRLLILPFRDPRRLARTVRLELFGQLPDEPEDALVAYESLGRVTEGSAVLAVVARQADIAAHRALLGSAGLSPLRIELAPLPAWNLLPPALANAGLLLADGTRSTLSIQRDGRIAGLRALLASADDAAALAAEARWSLAALGGIPSTLVVAGADAGPELATALADATRATVVPLAEVAGALPGDVTACAASSRVPPGARRSISCWPGVRARGRRRFAGASPSRWPPSSSVPSTWGSSTTGSRSAMLPSPRRSASRPGPRSRADGSSLRGPSSRPPSPQPATGRRGAARAPSASSATSARACPRRSRSTSTSWWSSPRASGSTGGRTASGRSTRSARLSPARPC